MYTNKMKNNETIKITTIEKQSQTWYDYYISPLFTADYYYAGQIATAIVVTAVVYWYVVPAATGYLYNHSKAEAPINYETLNSPSVIEKHLAQNINTLKEIDENDKIYNKLKEELQNLFNIYKIKVKETETYQSPEVVEHKNNILTNFGGYIWKVYQKDINTGHTEEEILQKIYNFKTTPPKVLDIQEKIAAEDDFGTDTIKLLTNTGIMNIEEKAMNRPYRIYKFLEATEQVSDVFPPELQYIPMLLTYAYNIAVCYYALNHEQFYKIKQTNIE